MTAIIATVQPGKAWVSTDSIASPHNGDPAFSFGPKFTLLPDGMVIAGAGDVHTLAVFVRWCGDVRGANRVAAAPWWLRNCGHQLTVFLVEPGRGWVLSYEDAYTLHPLALGIPASRPALQDPAPLRDLVDDPVALHRKYLNLITEEWRAGLVRHPNGAPYAVGGMGWTCVLTEGADPEVVALGEL